MISFHCASTYLNFLSLNSPFVSEHNPLSLFFSFHYLVSCLLLLLCLWQVSPRRSSVFPKSEFFITLSIVSAISVKPIFPARNIATSSSFAPFITTGALPPSLMAAYAISRHLNALLSAFSNVRFALSRRSQAPVCISSSSRPLNSGNKFNLLG